MIKNNCIFQVFFLNRKTIAFIEVKSQFWFYFVLRYSTGGFYVTDQPRGRNVRRQAEPDDRVRSSGVQYGRGLRPDHWEIQSSSIRDLRLLFQHPDPPSHEVRRGSNHQRRDQIRMRVLGRGS